MISYIVRQMVESIKPDSLYVSATYLMELEEMKSRAGPFTRVVLVALTRFSVNSPEGTDFHSHPTITFLFILTWNWPKQKISATRRFHFVYDTITFTTAPRQTKPVLSDPEKTTGRSPWWTWPITTSPLHITIVVWDKLHNEWGAHRIRSVFCVHIG